MFRRQKGFISGSFSFVKSVFEAVSTFYFFFLFLILLGKYFFFSCMCSEVVNLTHKIY